jgi:ADP-ribose pyrophosphatase YjhB (NUDIX family)
MDIRGLFGEIKFHLCARVVLLRSGEVLLVRGSDSGRLYPVGGHVMAGETTEQAAVRECLEETGLICKPERLLFITESMFDYEGQHNHELSMFYLMQPTGGELREQTDEGEQLVWVPIDEIDSSSRFKVLFPKCFKDALNAPPGTVLHFVSADGTGHT